MTRVNINGSVHQVEVQHDGADLAYVIEKARELWEQTAPPVPPTAPAFGFTAARQLEHNFSQYGPASFGVGDRPVVDR